MSVATQKILEMLENGKITAEQAEKLLNALKNDTQEHYKSQRKGKKKKFIYTNDPDLDFNPPDLGQFGAKIGPIIGSEMGEIMGAGKSHASPIEPSEVEKVKIVMGNGDIDIKNTEGYPRFDGGHTSVIKFKSGVLNFAVGNGEGAAEIPADVDLDVKSGMGDVKLDNLNLQNVNIIAGLGDIDIVGSAENIYLKSGRGDINCKVNANKLTATIGDGDADIKASNADEINVKIGNGDLDLAIENGATVEIKLRPKAKLTLPDGSEIISDETTGSLRMIRQVEFKFGDGSTDVKISLGSGDANIKLLM